MICKKPFMKGLLPFGCGQCQPCRINSRRVWTHRIVLESLTHSDNTFVTLTYDKDSLPEGGSLKPEHTRNFLKRLRKKIAPTKIRFFLVGEYGDKSERPHYHIALFGFPNCCRTRTDHRLDYCCESCQVIQEAWRDPETGKNYGGVDLGQLNAHSAQYVAGYTVKKMTNAKDEKVKKWLNGRHPEFARMSNGGRGKTGGIGAPALNEISALLTSDIGAEFLENHQDVPFHLLIGGKSWPMGKYLRQKLRDAYGMKPELSEYRLKQFADKMRETNEVIKENKPKFRNLYGAKLELAKNQQSIRNIESRNQLYNKEKKL